jgi:hypothetical protein
MNDLIKNFSSFGANVTPKNFFTNIETPKRHFLEKICVTNRFGDRDFILPVCTCFVSDSDRFEVIRDFRSLKNGEIPFAVDGSIGEKIWRHHSIPGWWFSFHFAGIFRLSLSVQKLFKNFMLEQWWNIVSIFGGKYDP